MKGDIFGRIICYLPRSAVRQKNVVSHVSNFRYPNRKSRTGVKIHVHSFTYFMFRVLFGKKSCLDGNAGRIRRATRWVILPIGSPKGN